MPDLDELHRTFSRVADLPDFRPDQRIWWIYMRNAAIEVGARGQFPDLAAACDEVKAFPENVPNERAKWLELRRAVAAVLSFEQFQKEPGLLGVFPLATDANDVQRDQADDAILPVTYGRGLARLGSPAEKLGAVHP